MYMKKLYLHPESESISLQAESLICQSSLDEGLGTIDPITSLDLDDDIWDPVW